jgi:hypothetical protein
MKILIAGDSFAADRTVKYPNKKGWPNLLSIKHQITNVAQAGVSEYKIYKQILSVKHCLQDYDIVIISHTSPYRAVTRSHPVHWNDPLHRNADLMLADIEYHSRSVSSLFNLSLQAARGYIKYHYDHEYQEVTFNLFKQEIEQILKNNTTIVISNFLNQDLNLFKKNFLDCSNLQQLHPGVMNHLSEQGNFMLYSAIENKINYCNEKFNNFGIKYI